MSLPPRPPARVEPKIEAPPGVGQVNHDFFVRELGPPVYNQGVRDAARYVQEQLADIDGEIYEDEPPV